jgi:8-oxo-dGTP pyrophosphatase MutT (NUDIX family)
MRLRRAARVLVVDAAGRVLLLREFDPRHPDRQWWITVGGGCEAGESSAQGAARELAEETGLLVEPAQLAGVVWNDVVEFEFDGVWCRQEQEYFAVRVDSWEVSHAGWDELERRSLAGHRWWSLAELESTADRFYPAELPELLRGVLAPAPGGVRADGSAGGHAVAGRRED